MSSSPATFGLLGLLATRSWTGYELTRQVGRSLRFIWPTSDGHLYREQKRLVTLGWAVVEKEKVGLRHRNRYAITEAGRAALRDWLTRPPEEPHLQIEGILRAFYAEQGSVADLRQSMEVTAEGARAMLADLRAFAEEYAADGGPLDLLENGIGGPEDRHEFRGRTMIPERLPGVAMALDITTRLLEVVERYFATEATLLDGQDEAPVETMIGQTRTRLQQILERTAPSGDGPTATHYPLRGRCRPGT